MTSDCTEALTDSMDAAAAQYTFPGWQCGEQNAVVGAMRATGVGTAEGAALVFEDVEYSLDERVIQSLAFCVTTTSTEGRVVAGNGVYLDVASFVDGDAPDDPESVEVTSRGRTFTVTVDRDVLASAGVSVSPGDPITPETVLVNTCEQVPSEWLFSDLAHLVDAFGLGSVADRVFGVESWEHPSLEELYADEIPPSKCPDLVGLAEAACADDSSPDLPGEPNTTWHEQCR